MKTVKYVLSVAVGVFLVFVMVGVLDMLGYLDRILDYMNIN